MQIRKFILIVLLLSGTGTSIGQGIYNRPDTSRASINPIREEKAKKLAQRYMELIAKGDNIDSIVSLSNVPYALDRGAIIYDKDSLRKIFQQVVNKKGKNRVFVFDSVYVSATRNEIIDKVIPLDIYYVVVKIKDPLDVKGRVREIQFGIQMSDEPKVIGFSD